MAPKSKESKLSVPSILDSRALLGLTHESLFAYPNEGPSLKVAVEDEWSKPRTGKWPLTF